MGSSLLLFADNKITQWEDPRLQNPAITGPVSTAVASSMQCPDWGTAGTAAGPACSPDHGWAAWRAGALLVYTPCQKKLGMSHQVLASLPDCPGFGDGYWRSAPIYPLPGSLLTVGFY